MSAVRIRVLAAALLALSAGAALAADAAAFEQALAAAEAARAKAASVAGEWRDTAGFIKQAQALAADGDYAAAVALARQAEHQGRRGYEQMTSQAGEVGPEPYMR